jgi:hypothetical protein
MDIVLLPRRPAVAGEADARLPAVAAMAQQFAAAGEPVHILAYLPDQPLAQQSELIRFMIECSKESGAIASLIVTGAMIAGGILEHPYLRAMDRLIIEVNESSALRGEDLGAIEAYREDALGQNQPVVLWIDFADRGRHGSLGPLFRAGTAGIDLEVRPIQVGAAGPTRGASAIDRAEAILPRCRLYDGTLTIDAAGQVIACGRHAGASDPPDLGALSANSVESIVLKKGRLSAALGTLEKCRTCQLSSRLLWPESRGDYTRQLMATGALVEPENLAGGTVDWTLATAGDGSLLSAADFDRMLSQFEQRLAQWAARAESAAALDRGPAVSIETPVIKVGWLIPCIESVLAQTSSRWQFSLLWDGGDERSRRVLEAVERVQHPRLSVYFGAGSGVARARRFLTERTGAEYILPLDDDDLLKPEAVEFFLETADARPWSGIIRARRDFVDDLGDPVEMDDWFPFGPRQYFRGMTCDMYNHSQPYLIARSAYERTTGWYGFPEYRFAGEDCDIFAKIEEVAEVELLDTVLYSYRLSGRRTSHQLGSTVAHDMWKRLALQTLERRQIPLTLTNEEQPFVFAPTLRTGADEGVDLLVLMPDAAGEGTSDWERVRAQWSFRTGIRDDAIHLLTPDRCNSLSIAEILANSDRSHVCLVRTEAEENSRAVLAALMLRMRTFDADLVGPKTVDREGRLLVAEPYFGSDLMPTATAAAAVDDGRYDDVVDAPWLPAMMLLVRRHVFRAVPALDAELAGDFQDADFCLRARQRDFRCVYAGDVKSVAPGRAQVPVSVQMRHRFLERWIRFPELAFPEQAAPHRLKVG